VEVDRGSQGPEQRLLYALRLTPPLQMHLATPPRSTPGTPPSSHDRAIGGSHASQGASMPEGGADLFGRCAMEEARSPAGLPASPASLRSCSLGSPGSNDTCRSVQGRRQSVGRPPLVVYREHGCEIKRPGAHTLAPKHGDLVLEPPRLEPEEFGRGQGPPAACRRLGEVSNPRAGG
jgi:hypothetical protein